MNAFLNMIHRLLSPRRRPAYAYVPVRANDPRRALRR